MQNVIAIRRWLISILLTIFSTSVMSYVSMATPIGPWIAPTLVLLAMLLFRLLLKKPTEEDIILTTVAGSVGGILSTALAFSFPTIYFLDKTTFNSWLSSPWYFSAVIGSCALVAGWFGCWIAHILEECLIVKEQLAFPVGQLIFKMVAVQENIRKAYELAIGFIGTTLFCLAQEGTAIFSGVMPNGLVFKGFIPKNIQLTPAWSLSAFSMPSIQFYLWPMLWAIGFVTGQVIALPLAAGAVVKIIIADPIHKLFFSTISSVEFVLAFCSGFVVSGAVMSFIGAPAVIWFAIKRLWSGQLPTLKANGTLPSTLRRGMVIEGILVIIAICSFLYYFDFPWLAMIYLIIGALICTYQIVIIAGKIGMAQLGRFATFVMVPALFIFPLNAVQLVLIATFVEISGGVATDILFGKKTAQLASLDRRRVTIYQYAGLLLSVIVVGLVFWFLISHFGLGSPQLFVQRAQARQLLIGVKSFNLWVLLIGFVFGYFLKLIKLNPMLVLGGILMPLDMSIALMLGGLGTLLTKQAEEWFPFWSGVFAANSLWMLLSSIVLIFKSLI